MKKKKKNTHKTQIQYQRTQRKNDHYPQCEETGGDMSAGTGRACVCACVCVCVCVCVYLSPDEC